MKYMDTPECLSELQEFLLAFFKKRPKKNVFNKLIVIIK